MILQIHQQTQAGLRQICRTLGVPRSSFYQAAQPPARQHSDQQIGALLETIFAQHRRRYGDRKSVV